MSDENWRRLFVGRDDELVRLQAAWSKVHRSDGGLAEPQMVVMLAESGLGKTRLVQEFYRWLSSTQDVQSSSVPEGYWPDAFARDSESLDVNPRFVEGIGKRETIPWLWWGIRFERPLDRNQIGSRCGLHNYLTELVMHTQPIVATRGLKKTHKNVFWLAIQKLAELTPGVSSAVAVVTAAKDLKELKDAASETRRLRATLSMSPAQNQQHELIQLEDLVFDYLSSILNPENKDAETVPVILFLDDAQWADPVTLQLLLRLMAASITNHWPLMVVCTHWEVEWKQFLHEPSMNANRPVRLSRVTETLRMASGDHTSWLDVHTLPPVSDLSGIVKTAFPGLTSEQRRTLLERSGGNPLLLEEILLFLNRRPEFFSKRQFDQPLTERGINELTERRFKLHELIDDRFHSLRSEVQRALGWSSEQGLTFLTEIVLASGRCVDPMMTEERLRALLREADWPHSLIQNLGDRGTFNRSEFRQAAFHVVASQYLRFQPEELASVQQAIRQTLTGWLLSGNVDQLPKEEQLDVLLMARRSLSAGPNAPMEGRIAWCRAMARLARLYREQYLWGQVWEVSESLARTEPDGLRLEWLDFWEQIALCRMLRSGAEFRLAIHIVRPLALTLSQFSNNSPDQQMLREYSVALNELGDSELAEGQRIEALSAYRRALDVCQRIITNFGETLESLQDLTISLNKVGDVEFAEGNRQAALAIFRRGLDISEQIVANFEHTPESLRDLTISLNKVGDVEFAEGCRKEALFVYRRALDISERIVASFGETPESLRDLTISLNKVGDVEFANSRPDEAIFCYRRGLEIRMQIVSGFGETPQSQRDLSVSFARIGDVEHSEGRHEAALAAYRRALEICDQIVAIFGETPQSLYDAVVSRFKMAGVDVQRSGEYLFDVRKGLATLMERNWLTAGQQDWIREAEKKSELLTSLHSAETQESESSN